MCKKETYFKNDWTIFFYLVTVTFKYDKIVLT